MSKADDIKQMRLDGVSMEPREASGRRKRAFHRALKRRALWAITEAAHRRIVNNAVNALLGYDFTDSTSVPMTGLSAWLPKVNEDDSKT